MGIYWLCILVPLLCSLFYNTKAIKFLLVSFLFFLIIISSFRVVGTDVPAYNLYFDSINYYSLDYPLYEKGYFLLNKCIRYFTNDFQYVLVSTSLLTILPVYITIKKYSINAFLSLFYFITLYFYFNSFNLIRQYIVISLLFFSVKYIINKQLIPFTILVFIASFFHITAIFFYLFYWLARIRYSRFSYIAIGTTSVLLTFSTPFLVKLVARVIPKFNSYINYDMIGASANFAILFSLIVFILSYLLRDKMNSIDKNSYVYMNFVFFTFCLSLLSINNIIFFRLASYLYIFIILLLPILLKSFSKKIKPISYFISCVSLVSYCYYLLVNNNGGVYPYLFSDRLIDNKIVIATMISIVLVTMLFKYFLKMIKEVSINER